MWREIAVWTSITFYLLFVIDRGWKFISIARFFERQKSLSSDKPLEGAEHWPSLSLIQPITRGASGLKENLCARLSLEYLGAMQHLLVCDAADIDSQNICRTVFAELSGKDFEIVCVEAAGGIASKVAKMQAGVAKAAGNVLCFIDDDVAPRPDNLRLFLQNLQEPDVGGVFGLACYTNWSGVGTSMMSAFVNANALYTYLPLTYLTSPFTMTGHFFAVRRDVWLRCGGLNGLAPNRSDDDHEIARRIRHIGFKVRQTDAVYDVNNSLPSLGAYNRQMQRWSTFMRLWCWPYLTLRERAVSLVTMLGSLLLAPLMLLAIATPGRITIISLVGAILVTIRMHMSIESQFLRRFMPGIGWLYFAWAVFVTPYQMLLSPLFGNVIDWRGQKMRVLPDGLMERVE